jgi:hypothetical protein
MTTKQPLLVSAIVLLISFAQQANAKIWRVNKQSNYNGSTLWGDNFGGNAAYPVFAEINDAVEAAINGDTLHVEGSPGIYNIGTITKKLVIIGAGYFMTENSETSANTLDTKVYGLSFEEGSDRSVVMGCNIVGTAGTEGSIYIHADGITIKRCRIEIVLYLYDGITDLYVLENFFASISGVDNVFKASNPFVPPTGLTFNNNICHCGLLWGFPYTATPTTLWPIAQCNNNIFDGEDNLATPTLAFSTGGFKNNILMATNAKVNITTSGGTGVIANNIGTLLTQFGIADNNLVVPDITSLFVSSTSTDGAYQIADGTAADNSGSDGTDRGAFGGASVTSRYTLSGLAPVPVIYQISTAGVSDATGLPVTIKARIIK